LTAILLMAKQVLQWQPPVN